MHICSDTELVTTIVNAHLETVLIVQNFCAARLKMCVCVCVCVWDTCTQFYPKLQCAFFTLNDPDSNVRYIFQKIRCASENMLRRFYQCRLKYWWCFQALASFRQNIVLLLWTTEVTVEEHSEDFHKCFSDIRFWFIFKLWFAIFNGRLCCHEPSCS